MPRPRQAGSTQRRRTCPVRGATARRPTPPTGGPAASPRAGDQEGTVRRVEHGRGEAQFSGRRARRSAPRARPRPAPPPSAAPRRRRAPGTPRCPSGERRWGVPYPLSFPRGRGRPFPAADQALFPVFSPVPPDIDFVALEQAELARWAAHRVFERSIDQREGAAAVGLLRGPAHRQRHAGPAPRLGPGLQGPLLPLPHHGRRLRGPPGRLGHPRAPRRGRGGEEARHHGQGADRVPGRHRRVHPAVPRVGLLLRRRVRAPDHPHRLLGRHGCGVLDAEPDYIESVWWHLQQLFDQGLLYEDLKVVPYCPRCGTALSSHELGQPDVYRDEEDESAYVRFRLVDPSTPKRPPPATAGRGRVAGRVDDHAVDAAVEHGRGGEPGPGLRRRRRGGRWPTTSSTTSWGRGPRPGSRPRVPGVGAGRAALRAPLRRPRPAATAPTAGGWSPPSYVTTEEGTGLVHLAPAFGEVDRQIGRENGLPSLNPVGPDGALHRRRRVAGRARRAGGQPRHQRPAGGGGSAAAPLPLRPLVPALLALPHAAHLLGQAELVHRHVDPQGRPAGGQRDGGLAPGAHPGRALRRMAREQRRLGPVA